MLNRRLLLAASICTAARFGHAENQSAGTLDDAEMNRLLKLLAPDPTKPWRTIPWQLSVLDAQGIAAAHNKPIFIWAMDGHPLGCT